MSRLDSGAPGDHGDEQNPGADTDELEDAELEGTEPDEGVLDAGEESADEYEEEEEPAAAPAVFEAPPGRPGRGLRTPAKAAPAAPTPSELAVRIDDRVSQGFVIAVAAAFALVFLYAIFLGQAGVFTGVPAPSPSPSAAASLPASPSPAASPSASPSPSAAASATPAASPSAVASPSPGLSPSAAASPSPGPSPSASPASPSPSP